jgi:hypothetical protein
MHIGFMAESLREHPAGRPKRRSEDISKVELREVGCDNRESIELPQDRSGLRRL